MRRRRRLRRVPRRQPRARSPPGVLREYERVYPFGWLGILADGGAVDRGARSTPTTSAASRCTACARPTISRLYIQVAPDEDIDDVVGRPDLGRAAPPPRARRRLDAARGAGAREGHRAAAQLRRRADAARAPLPRRRRRAHRAADRREGPQPRGRRRDGARRARSATATRPAARPGSTRTRTRACAASGRAERF